VLSSDTDVLILFLYYWNELKSEGLEELRIRTGVRNTSRHVLVHDLADKIGQTKHAALKANPEKYLMQFRTTNDTDRQVVVAEEYLVQVLKKPAFKTCRSLDQLRCHLYHSAKRPCLDDLPPTSNAAKLHIKRAFYATHQMINVMGKTEMSRIVGSSSGLCI